MKKILLVVTFVLSLSVTTLSFAFLYDIPILSKEEIKALSDAELINQYIDVKVELDASRTFHGQAGFTPKEYNRHKEMLNLVIKLRLEMQLRDLDVPPIDEWLR